MDSQLHFCNRCGYSDGRHFTKISIERGLCHSCFLIKHYRNICEKKKEVMVTNKSNVFEVIVVKHPGSGKSSTETTKIVVPLKHVVASDADAAKIQAIRSIPESHMKDTSRLEVLIRPFHSTCH